MGAPGRPAVTKANCRAHGRANRAGGTWSCTTRSGAKRWVDTTWPGTTRRARMRPVSESSAATVPASSSMATSEGDRLGPVAELEQHQRMEHQHQVGDGDQLVCLGEPVVGNALDEGHDDQQRRAVEPTRPNSRPDGAVRAARFPADRCRPGVARAGGRTIQPRLLHPLGALRQPPVRHRGQQRRDAQPFVQPVHLVQAVQARFQPPRARQPEAPGPRSWRRCNDAAELDGHVAKSEVAGDAATACRPAARPLPAATASATRPI